MKFLAIRLTNKKSFSEGFNVIFYLFNQGQIKMKTLNTSANFSVLVSIKDFDTSVIKRYLETGSFSYNYSLKLVEQGDDVGNFSHYHPCALVDSNPPSPRLLEFICENLHIQIPHSVELELNLDTIYDFAETEAVDIDELVRTYKDLYYDSLAQEIVDIQFEHSKDFTTAYYINGSTYDYADDFNTCYHIFNEIISNDAYKDVKEWLFENSFVEDIETDFYDLVYDFECKLKEAYNDLDSNYEVDNFDTYEFLDSFLTNYLNDDAEEDI